jgi:Alginate export
MRIFSILAVMFLVGIVPAHAQSDQTTDPPAPVRSYKLLTEDEDWSFLKDPTLRQDFWDPIKYIPLWSGSQGSYLSRSYLSIGGEAREVWEQIGNDNWGQQPYMNGYFNQRYMLHFDAHFGEHVRTFVELKSALNSFRIGGPRPIDEKRLDFQAAFLEVGTSGDGKSIRFRVGRQELYYGSGRLIDLREGPNSRLSFDGFMIKAKADAWSADAFAMRPDLDNFGFFDNYPNHAIGFWGLYATRTMPHKETFDVYYLGLNSKAVNFERGTAQEVRHSLGARIFHPAATERHGLDFDFEGVWQFGTFGKAGIEAWTLASNTGYKFPEAPLKPRFSVNADIASGDHPGSNTLGTFNPLYPSGHYFGVFASTGPGPLNFEDIHPKVQLEAPRGVSIFADWIFQWRQSLEDGVYAIPGFLITAADGSRARFVGDRPGTEVQWQANRHLWFQADYGIFYAGPFIKQTLPGRNLNYWALWAGYKF